MLLAIDVGNSEITIGVWSNHQWQQHWRISSRSDQPALFYTMQLRDHFLEAGVDTVAIETVVLSSVVPLLGKKMESVIAALFDKPPVILGPEVYKKLPVQILNPYEIGSDLVANAVAAWTRFRQACIVVDFGTALTFTTLSTEGRVIGVSIAPGLQTAIRALSDNTAKLFEVPLEMPESALGTSTVSAIQSGVLLGYEGLVKNMVSHIRAELKQDCIAVATGGLSSVITPLRTFFHITEPRLTLDGLRIIGELIAPGLR